MNDAKYIGLDVHQATISVAVLDSAGNARVCGRSTRCAGWSWRTSVALEYSFDWKPSFVGFGNSLKFDNASGKSSQ